MENLFNVVVNDYPVTSKPTDEEVRRYIRPYWRNTIQRLTIHQLAELIQQGHSFYPNVLDYRLNTKTKAKDPTQPSMSLNGTCYLPTATSLISVDVDHGNFTLEELKVCIASVPHALIYKTMSYRDDYKKYRVVFMSNRCFKDEAEFRLVQCALIYLFAHPFAHRLEQLNQKVDFSVKDPARISFPGHVIQEEIHDRTFDLDLFIQQCHQLNILKLMEDFIQAWKGEESRRQGQTLSTPSQTQINPLSAPKSEKDREEVVQSVIRALERYKASHDLPLMVAFPNTMDFVNQIPLTFLLQHPVGLPFCCYLPHHDDHHPSAVLLEDEHKHVRYYCHGCQEGHSLSTFDFLEAILHDRFGYDRYQVITFIFETLGIKLTSEYRNEALMRLQLMRDFLNELPDENELKRLLVRRNLFNLYELMINLASTKIGLQPVTQDKTNPNPSFFVSSNHIYYQMVQVRGLKRDCQTIEKSLKN